MKTEMQPDDQWKIELLVYPSDSAIFGYSYSAFVLASGENELVAGMDTAKLTGHGDTPALAIADLFKQAHHQLER
jgi:hypothetical protein